LQEGGGTGDPLLHFQQKQQRFGSVFVSFTTPTPPCHPSSFPNAAQTPKRRATANNNAAPHNGYKTRARYRRRAEQGMVHNLLHISQAPALLDTQACHYVADDPKKLIISLNISSRRHRRAAGCSYNKNNENTERGDKKQDGQRIWRQRIWEGNARATTCAKIAQQKWRGTNGKTKKMWECKERWAK